MLELVNVGSIERGELLGTCEKSLKSETMIMVSSGSINVSGPDFELTINEGRPVLLPAGVYLLSNISKSENNAGNLLFITLSVDFIARLIDKYGTLFNRENSFDVYGYNEVDVDYLLKHAVVLISNNIEKRAANPHLIALKVEEIFLLMLSQPQGQQFEQTLKWIGSSSSRRLRQFMNENYRKSWSLEQFAAQFNTSLSSFKSLFNRVYHITPKAWINEMRLQYAYNQLVNTDKSIIDIALESGFNSQSYFTQLYRKRFNQTPSHSRYSVEEHDSRPVHFEIEKSHAGYLAMTA